MTYTYNISGMTCGSCVEKISQRLKAISGVSEVNITLQDKKADISADRPVLLKEVQEAIADLPKYKADFFNEPETVTELPKPKTFLETYKPLFTIFAYIFTFCIAYQLSLEKFSAHLFMNHIMAGFFIGLSFFKFLDLKSFATAFANYDPLAKKWNGYGLVYPFIELALGFLFIAGKLLLVANVLTIVVLTLSTIGVSQNLKKKIQCACLGAGFNIPLSNITVFENVAMIAMAIYSVLKLTTAF